MKHLLVGRSRPVHQASDALNQSCSSYTLFAQRGAFTYIEASVPCLLWHWIARLPQWTLQRGEQSKLHCVLHHTLKQIFRAQKGMFDHHLLRMELHKCINLIHIPLKSTSPFPSVSNMSMTLCTSGFCWSSGSDMNSSTLREPELSRSSFLNLFPSLLISSASTGQRQKERWW